MLRRPRSVKRTDTLFPSTMLVLSGSALGSAGREARSGNQPGVDRAIDAADLDPAGADIGTDQRSVARRHRLAQPQRAPRIARRLRVGDIVADRRERRRIGAQPAGADAEQGAHWTDRKSTRLNSSN